MVFKIDSGACLFELKGGGWRIGKCQRADVIVCRYP